MLGRTHKVGGVSGAFIASTILYTNNYPMLNKHPILLSAVVAGGLLGGLMPDIDHPNATISRFRIFGIPIFKPISWVINALFGHRGATHTLWALILTWLPFIIGPLVFTELPVLTEVLIILFGIGYASGYFSHLLLDSLTPSGTPMLWPLPDIHLAKLPTGKHDTAVSLFMAVGTGIICGGLLYFSGFTLPKLL